jgi:hypothetical protein
MGKPLPLVLLKRGPSGDILSGKQYDTINLKGK